MAWNLVIKAALNLAKQTATKIAKSKIIGTTKTGIFFKVMKTKGQINKAVDFVKSIKKVGVKEVLKETAKEKAYDTVIGKVITWKDKKERLEQKQKEKLSFKDEKDNYAWSYKESRQYNYHPNFFYDFALKNYGYRFNYGIKLWREYRRLKKELERQLDVYLNKILSFEKRQYQKDKKRLERQLLRQELQLQRKIISIQNKFSKLEKEMSKWFEIDDKLKWSKFKETNELPLSYKNFNLLRREVYTKAAKQKYNVNQLNDELKDFTDWMDTLSKEEQELITNDIFRTQKIKIDFMKDGWIKSAIWIPISLRLEPNKLVINNLKENESVLLKYKNKTAINDNTRGFLHVWVNKPSKRNPSGKYTWWNITLRTWKKIKQERTTAAFEKYFYKANKANMMYLLPNSIYWRKSQKSIKWMNNNNKVWKDNSKIKRLRRQTKKKQSGWLLPSKSTI